VGFLSPDSVLLFPLSLSVLSVARFASFSFVHPFFFLAEEEAFRQQAKHKEEELIKRIALMESRLKQGVPTADPELLEKLKPLIVKDCPFKTVPEYNKPSRFRPNPPKATVTWVKPKVIAEISYAEQTSDGAIRHPSFEGLREDKNANEVTREKEKSTEDIVSDKPTNKKEMATTKTEKKTTETKITAKQSEQKQETGLQSRLFKVPGAAERKTLLNPKDKSQTRTINGYDITFNNVNKIYYPAVNGNPAVTKRDIINYYYKVAPYILPYMKDRPQTLIRYPNGIEGESFYQKRRYW